MDWLTDNPITRELAARARALADACLSSGRQAARALMRYVWLGIGVAWMLIVALAAWLDWRERK